MTLTKACLKASSAFALGSLLLIPQACSREGAQATAPDRLSNAESPQAKAEGKLVGIMRLVPRKVEDRLPCTTHVEVHHAVDILAEVQGQVVEVPIREGQVVEKGTVLCKLEDSEARLALESARNEEKIAETFIDEMDLDAEETKKKIEQAKVNLRDAQKELDRATKGVAQQLTSASALEDAQLAYAKAKHELALGEFAARKCDLEHAKARNQRDQKILARKIQERILEKYTIRAPFRGVVPELKVKGGEWVSSNLVLFQLYDSDRLEVNISRPQRQFGLLQKGQIVEIQVDAWPDQVFRGRIYYLSPVVDMQTGSFLVRATIEDPEKKLRPGMFCRADIITRESREALMIPKIAVLYEGDLPHAFVARKGKAHRILIQQGIELKDSLEALNKGIAGESDSLSFLPGDAVIIKGKEKLVEGDAVRFHEEAPNLNEAAKAVTTETDSKQAPKTIKSPKDSGGD